jgi:PAS domain S-box-containing protein
MMMNFEQTRSLHFYDQIQALAFQAKNIRQALEKSKISLPTGSIEGLYNLALSLEKLGQQIDAFEKEHGNLLALANIAQVVNSSLNLDEVLRIVMDNIVRLTHAERGFLMLRDQEGNMTLRTARNWEQGTISPSELTISHTVIQRVLESGEAVLTTNAREDPRFGEQESVITFNLRSILCVPLKVKNELIGVIYADNRIRSGIFSETERNLLIGFANQAAVALENARLFSSLRATLAEITELKNKMDNIFASIASGVITVDGMERITSCNRAAEAILGCSADEIVGHRLEETWPMLAGQIQPAIRQVCASDKAIIDWEISLPLPGRGTADWRLTISPLKDSQQKTQGVALVVDDLTERKKLEAQRRLLERMLSPVVLAQIDPDRLHLGGQRTEISILFADLRDFTSFGEKQAPEHLVEVLNRYLAVATGTILEQEGTIDKFLGDAIMAWFNAPLPQPDHTLRAVKAALRLREMTLALQRHLPEKERLSFGTGIHIGDAVLGWVGSEKRLEFTAISDSVNTAWRIQERAAKNQILISKDAYLRVQADVEARKMSPIRVKGKSQPLEVYEVLGLKK